MGRIDFSRPERPRFWQPVVYFIARFTGTRCEVFVNDKVLWGKKHNYLEVVVDETAMRLQTKGTTNTVEADDLKEGPHTLLLCTNTKANIAWIELISISPQQLHNICTPKSQCANDCTFCTLTSVSVLTLRTAQAGSSSCTGYTTPPSL